MAQGTKKAPSQNPCANNIDNMVFAACAYIPERGAAS